MILTCRHRRTNISEYPPPLETILSAGVPPSARPPLPHPPGGRMSFLPVQRQSLNLNPVPQPAGQSRDPNAPPQAQPPTHIPMMPHGALFHPGCMIPPPSVCPPHTLLSSGCQVGGPDRATLQVQRARTVASDSAPPPPQQAVVKDAVPLPQQIHNPNPTRITLGPATSPRMDLETTAKIQKALGNTSRSTQQEKEPVARTRRGDPPPTVGRVARRASEGGEPFNGGGILAGGGRDRRQLAGQATGVVAPAEFQSRPPNGTGAGGDQLVLMLRAEILELRSLLQTTLRVQKESSDRRFAELKTFVHEQMTHTRRALGDMNNAIMCTRESLRRLHDLQQQAASRTQPPHPHRLPTGSSHPSSHHVTTCNSPRDSAGRQSYHRGVPGSSNASLLHSSRLPRPAPNALGGSRMLSSPRVTQTHSLGSSRGVLNDRERERQHRGTGGVRKEDRKDTQYTHERQGENVEEEEEGEEDRHYGAESPPVYPGALSADVPVGAFRDNEEEEEDANEKEVIWMTTANEAQQVPAPIVNKQRKAPLPKQQQQQQLGARGGTHRR
uniref:Uncharacterized protein n=1 Tax=Chromera velia CCMP2878 TaxID=1169474 RepID=A0A0G4HCF1_9ALVE|eukprot:Cvel_26100.t1-p1 / transcript=Cvel_26100.t1 / gene=Cvel_26100 / organism=Chromera_velia_CCMP2878 / gene_product=hypothetical protein / transcript_product=hypothetical protein / location=Cvel_scaffold3050:13746-17046(+) / protein_length=553 / sequence_SO=supercontig / SO=protein_coding / is_pseudo=false